MTDPPTVAPPVARAPAIVGFALGVAAALLAVWWKVAIPLAVVALAVCWHAFTRARGRDTRTVGFAAGGLSLGVLAVALGLASFAAGDATPSEATPSVIDGIESSTPDEEHPPQRDLEPGTQCTVDLAGLRAEGTIVNRSERPWRYRLRIVWDDSGTQLAEGTSLLDELRPGASTPFTVVSPKTGTTATTCRVAQIDRLAP